MPAVLKSGGLIILVVYVCSCASGHNSPHAAMYSAPASMIGRHFYVYNECYQSIIVHSKYRRIGDQAAHDEETTIGVNGQELIAVVGVQDSADFAAIEASAKSADGKSTWAECTIRSSVEEFTYVIGCDCPSDKKDCNRGDAWPYPTFRQEPILQGFPASTCSNSMAAGSRGN
jgi:hypothetical protein